jgi:predicted metal-dependent hydrolase
VDLFEQGRQAFNEERYFQAHELWEELWTPMRGVERRRLQGMIHCAVGLYHFHRDNRTGAMRQFQKALAKTADCPAGWRGITIKALRENIGHLLALLETGERPQAPAIKL